jgi:AraC-like DNA-binding protein
MSGEWSDMTHQTPVIAHSVTPTRSGGRGTVLVADFGDAGLRALFLELTTTEFTLHYVDDRTRLVTTAIALRPTAVLLPVQDAAGTTCAPLAARLCAEAPDVRVITLWRPDHDHDELTEAIRAGSELFAVRAASDIIQCVADLRGAGTLSTSDLDAVRALLADLEPPWLVEILLASARWAHRGLSVGDFAQLAGYSRRTLGRQTIRAGWPVPAELVEWGRLLRASLIQWREQSTLAALAHASGFTGPHALHRTADRLLGEKVVLPGTLTPLGVSSALRRRLTR